MQWSYTVTKKHTRLRVAITVMVLFVLALWSAFFWRLHAYDTVIREAATFYEVDARLVRAVIWKESRFHAKCRGTRGEIGLMQVMDAAAWEWAQAGKMPCPSEKELFSPAINVKVGTWYLSRALRFWADKADPLPYALAEYNAGRSNSLRWSKNDGNDPRVFLNNITYPGTRRYIQDILTDYRGLP